ncbi:MAG: SIR2 family protein, partial [Desulfovibrio sp.]
MPEQKTSKKLRMTPSGNLASQIASPAPGECPYTLLLGAGASVSSGIPHVKDLIEEWKQEIYCDEKELLLPLSPDKFQEYKSWERTEYKDILDGIRNELATVSEYGTLFQHKRKTREERQMYVEQLITGKSPCPGYFYLASLIDSGRFNRVLTTNFDDLVNDALVAYFNVKPINCAFDSAVNSFNPTSLRPKIIKLHGDYLYDNLKNTDEELQDLSTNMEEKMVEMCENKGLIVIGYGGDDESVMTPIRENLRKNKKFITKGIHWCIHVPDGDKAEIREEDIPEKLATIRRRHPDRVFLYSIESFDKFMESVFTRCRLAFPLSILKPYESNAANVFYESCEALERSEKLSIQTKQHMTIAMKGLTEARASVQLEIRKADCKFRDGRDARDLDKDYKSAIEHFSAAISIFESIEAEQASSIERLQIQRRKIGC